VAELSLPARRYNDPEGFERERHAVFGRSWLFAGFAAELREPGDYLAVELAGWPVVLVVDDDGRVRGHHNVCRHRAGPLVPFGSSGRVPSLVCRYHGWAYGLDGELRSARDFGEACDGVALVPVHVEVWRGLVFVDLALDGTPHVPLLDELGDFADACASFPLESFTPVRHADHELACDWKTYGDNYLEGYHIPLVHPGLNKEIDAKQYRVDVHAEHRWVEHSAPARDGAVNLGRWLWRWPNLALNLYPGGLNVERWEPLAAGRCRLRYSYAFADSVSAEERDEVVRVSTEVTAEDAAICEAVQRNLEAGVYDRGWLSPKHEQAVAAFQAWIRHATPHLAL
jgi:choline monooxygenase